MALHNTQTSYGTVARGLHWLIALLVIGNVALGLYAEDAPRTSDSEVARLALLYSLHKTAGIAILLLAVARIGWAFVQPKPRPLHPDRRVETFLAEAVHWSLYLAILIMPLSGWLGHAASEGFAPILWPLGQSLPFLPKSPGLAALFFAAHGAAAKLLVLSVALHVAGALKHALIDRDGLLARMITGRPSADGGAAPDRRARLAAGAAWALVILLGVAVTPPSRDQAAPAGASGNWIVKDGTLIFTVNQMQTPITGTLPGWNADITYDAGTRSGAVSVTIPLSGMTLGAVTAQAAGPEFFDSATHPTARFEATIAERSGQLEAAGNLMLRSKTVPVTLPFTLTLDGDRASMTGQTVLDRRDFGMGPSFPDERTVGFAVEVHVTLTATRR